MGFTHFNLKKLNQLNLKVDKKRVLDISICTTGVHTLLSCQKANFFRNLRVTPSCLKGYYLFNYLLKNNFFSLFEV